MVKESWVCRFSSQKVAADSPLKVRTRELPLRQSDRPSRQSGVSLYEQIELEKMPHPLKWTLLLRNKRFTRHHFEYVDGSVLTAEWAKKTGFRQPVIVLNPQGLNMTMPSSTLSVRDVAKSVGLDRKVNVMQVNTQEELIMTMGEWADYYEQSPQVRKRILNVISLEISSSALGKSVVRPQIVRELDWIDNVWPADLKPIEYPQVQCYCLMSVKNSYTDFHVDFGGTSVFYHVLSGEKVFYFIEPTKVNLKKYKNWSSSPDQSSRFLGDEVTECIEVVLRAGNRWGFSYSHPQSMLIPTGWIHAVFTPKDSVVIGGNFLHGINIDGQLDIYDIEVATSVPAKFRFPYYEKMQWYAAQAYLARIQKKQKFSQFELNGLEALAEFLIRIVQNTKDPNDEKQVRQKAKFIPDTFGHPLKFAKKFQLAVTKARTTLMEETCVTPESPKATLHIPLSPAKTSAPKKEPLGDTFNNAAISANTVFESFDPEFGETGDHASDSGSDFGENAKRELTQADSDQDDVEPLEKKPRSSLKNSPVKSTPPKSKKSVFERLSLLSRKLKRK